MNATGASAYVKFHWKPKLGLQSVVWNEAVKINGADPDFHRRDLWQAIESGDFPEWELGVQIFDDELADVFEFDVLDATKLIPEEQVPVRPIGRMVLNRTVDNFFAETEQVAFCTANVVRSPISNRTDTWPSRTRRGESTMSPTRGRLRSRASFADHYSQARQFYASQTPIEQAHISDAFAFELSKVEREDIRMRMVANLRNVDELLAATVATGLGVVELPDPSVAASVPVDLPVSSALSILANPVATFSGRKLGFWSLMVPTPSCSAESWRRPRRPVQSSNWSRRPSVASPPPMERCGRCVGKWTAPHRYSSTPS